MRADLIRELATTVNIPQDKQLVTIKVTRVVIKSDLHQ